MRLYDKALVAKIHANQFTKEVDGIPVLFKPVPDAEPAHLDPRLREIYAGQWEGVSFTALAERYPKEYAAWKAGSCCDPVGGERAAQAGRRFFDAVSSLCRENEGKAILIVAHAMVIRCFECLVRYGSTEALCRVPFVHNAALSRYAWATDGFSLREWDVYGYLGTLATTLPKTV